MTATPRKYLWWVAPAADGPWHVALGTMRPALCGALVGRNGWPYATAVADPHPPRGAQRCGACLHRGPPLDAPPTITPAEVPGWRD